MPLLTVPPNTPSSPTVATPPRDARPRLRAGRAGAVLFAVLLMALVIAGWSSPSASAGSINVWACHQPNGQQAPLDGWDWNVTATGIYPWNFCDQSNGYFGMGIYQEFHPYGSYGAWTFRAPANTTVRSLRYVRSTGLAGFTRYGTFAGTTPGWLDDSVLEACQPSGCTQWASEEKTLNVGDRAAVLLYLQGCTQAGGCNEFTSGWLDVHRAAVTLSDQQIPTFGSPTGPLTQAGPLHGNAGLSVQLADAGTGLYKLHATVDGASFDDRVLDSNDGKCQPVSGARDFLYTVPCRLNLSASTTLDTATLPDGQHDVRIDVEDAAGNLATAFHQTVVTENAPGLLDRPAITGAAKIDAQLIGTTGSWSRTPTGYGYQWLRCPAGVTSPTQADSCSPIAGATQPTYQATAGDVYGRTMLRVAASNANGSAQAFSAPSSIVLDAQGRATAPAPSDSGPRDVVVVPVPPGGSSTTIIGGSTSGPSYSIVGLRNPLADQAGHVPNGTNAAAGARIQIAFELRPRGTRKQVRVVRSSRNRRWVIKGRVLAPNGKPIGGAVLVTAWQMPGQPWRAHTGIKARADGRFTYILPKGPTRAIRFVYFAFSDSSTYNASNVVTEKVTTPVALRVVPHAASNGQRIKFTGTVATDFIPKTGVLVTLQARYPGGGWKQFATARAGRNGRFAASYRFTHTSTATRYAFRAMTAKQAGYPFEGGTSRLTEVLVTP
jgi:hypothetical protein